MHLIVAGFVFNMFKIGFPQLPTAHSVEQYTQILDFLFCTEDLKNDISSRSDKGPLVSGTI